MLVWFLWSENTQTLAVDEETLVKLHFSNPSGLNLYTRRSDV